MHNSQVANRRFPVTVRNVPTVACSVCGRTVASEPGSASAALTKHYEREHADVLSVEP